MQLLLPGVQPAHHRVPAPALPEHQYRVREGGMTLTAMLPRAVATRLLTDESGCSEAGNCWSSACAEDRAKGKGHIYFHGIGCHMGCTRK